MNYDGDLITMKNLLTNPKSKFSIRSKFNRWTPFQEIVFCGASDEKISELSEFFFKELKKRKGDQGRVIRQ